MGFLFAFRFRSVRIVASGREAETRHSNLQISFILASASSLTSTSQLPTHVYPRLGKFALSSETGSASPDEHASLTRTTTKRGQNQSGSNSDVCDKHPGGLWRRTRSSRGAIIDTWFPCVRFALHDRLEGSWQMRVSMVEEVETKS